MPDFFNTCDRMTLPSEVITEVEVATGYMPQQPKIVREIASPVVLTTSWQRLDLATLTANTFPGTSPNKLVDWDSTNKLFKYNDGTTRNYIAALNMRPSVAGILVTPIVLPIQIHFRFVVPDGVSLGVDYYFPFATDVGYMELAEIAWNGTQRPQQRLTPITSDPNKRATGVGCEAKLSSSPLTGSISIAFFSIYMFGA